MLRSFAALYQQAFDTRPSLTLATANAFLSSFADCVAQSSQIFLAPTDERPPAYDWARTARFFAFGTVMGPIIGRWNKVLELAFPLRTPNRPRVNPIALAKRVGSDQIFMAPLGIAAFIGSMGFMEGRSDEQIAQKYRDMFVPALLTNWKVWPLAQLINFRYMPLAYRVPFSQTCGVFWNLYLSLLNAKEDQKQDKDQVDRQTLDS